MRRREFLGWISGSIAGVLGAGCAKKSPPEKKKGPVAREFLDFIKSVQGKKTDEVVNIIILNPGKFGKISRSNATELVVTTRADLSRV